MDLKLDSYIPLHETDNTKDFLRDFFEILPPNGSKNLAADIAGCATDTQLRQLVQSIRSGLLIPLKGQGGKTPTDVTPSRLGVEDSIENLKSQDIGSITRSSQSRLRTRCLERDGNQCCITGYYSPSHPHPPNVATHPLEAAHILPFALGSFKASDGQSVDQHTTIWVNLLRYFPALREMAFTSEEINSEKNVLMLNSVLHAEFGQFRMIFEETEVIHQYHIKTFPEISSVPIRDLPSDRIVRFTVHKGSSELPDPYLLKIHACIGNFLHISGQAEVIDKILEDFGDCGSLAPSGSTPLEDILAVSSLALLSSNVLETADPHG